MYLFEVVATDGATLSVFGENFDEAATLFTAWYMANRDTPLPDFEVKQRIPRWPGLNTQHLEDALARKLSGVGRYDPVVGWAILSPLDAEEK